MSTEASAPPVTRLDLKAPLTGVLVPIEQVPDPVFAQKMVGEGISIDPLSDHLLAPFDGEVIHLHAGLNADQYAAEMRGQLAAVPAHA